MLSLCHLKDVNIYTYEYSKTPLRELVGFRTQHENNFLHRKNNKDGAI